MPDLKRCPFCDGNPKTEVRITRMASDGNALDFAIVCGECGVHKTVRVRLNFANTADFWDVEKAMDEVALAWNRRATNG
jgi:transcriptional regulator NrdR family protein